MTRGYAKLIGFVLTCWLVAALLVACQPVRPLPTTAQAFPQLTKSAVVDGVGPSHASDPAQAKAEDSRRATETTRAYLESILGNLSAGVLVFDERHRLRTVNPSAAVILQQPLAELTGMSLADWGKRLRIQERQRDA